MNHQALTPYFRGFEDNIRKNAEHPFLKAALAEVDALRAKLNADTCNNGHKTRPLSLWDCPVCIKARICNIAQDIANAQNPRAAAEAVMRNYL